MHADERTTDEDSIPLLCSGCRHGAEVAQASYFDAVDEEWEIERPWGAPRLHGWLLAEKFRRGVSALELRGRTVLAACAGSGMDAELLARAGARVVAVDISPWSCEAHPGTCPPPCGGCRARRRRPRAPPFGDRCFDIAYIHDGLHHLEQPEAGLAELARVARVAVSVNEPARAAATHLAVRAGLALEREDSGNLVARLAPEEVRAELRRRGFRTVRHERYAMYYKHEPGRAARALSRPIAYELARGLFLVGNRVAGRIGNKLAVQAVREPEA